jgi:hypothetical protein
MGRLPCLPHCDKVPLKITRLEFKEETKSASHSNKQHIADKMF